MDFQSASSDSVTISRVTAEQALEALDRAQKILASARNLNHAAVLAAYQALRGAVNPPHLPQADVVTLAD